MHSMFDTNVLFTPLCVLFKSITASIVGSTFWSPSRAAAAAHHSGVLVSRHSKKCISYSSSGQKVWTSNPNIIKYLIQHENSIKGWRTRTRENEPTKTSLNEYIYYHITRYRVSERSVSKC